MKTSQRITGLFKKPAEHKPFHLQIRDYVIAMIAILATAGICFPFSKTIGYQAVGLILLMMVALLSLFLGRGAVLFAAVLNFITWNFFFIPPFFTLRVHSIHDLITLFVSLLVALVGGTLITRLRKSQHDLRKSKDRISLLYSFLEELNDSRSIKEVVKKTVERMNTQFNADTIIYLKEKEGKGLSRKAFGNTSLFGEDEFKAAEYAFINGVQSGQLTAFFPGSPIRYYPLTEPRRTIGVLGLLFNENENPDEDRQLLLKSFIVQITSALDREISIDYAKEKEIFSESEKLFQTVLNSVSHELRTPLAIISAAVSNLTDEKTSGNLETRKQICQELDLTSKRMNYLVENILDMSRLDSGHLQLNLQFCDVSDLVGMVVHSMKGELNRHKITIQTSDGLPLIRADINLLKQALINVLHNAVTYSPAGKEISIRSLKDENGRVIIEVSDKGNGVPPASLSRLFDKFYRVPGSRSGGTGLGLTITKAIIEAHQGKIMADNCPGGGLKISMILIPDLSDGKE